MQQSSAHSSYNQKKRGKRKFTKIDRQTDRQKSKEVHDKYKDTKEKLDIKKQGNTKWKKKKKKLERILFNSNDDIDDNHQLFNENENICI